MKICRKCNIKLPISNFTKSKDTKDKLKNWCKGCTKLYNVAWNKDPQNILNRTEYNKSDKVIKKRKINNSKPENKLKKKEFVNNYYLNHKEEKKEYQRLYKLDNPDYMNSYFKNRRDTDPLFKLQGNIRCLINISLKGTKSKKTREILGCTNEAFKLYLENKFESWMNWEIYGKYNGEFNYGWDLDHIIPLSSAKDEEELLKLNHYTNFQPLCSKINRDIKKDKLNYGE